MDIFALPDVFIRKLMRTMEIEDRMRLRLVCRAFEQLAADSHAGYFAVGGIYKPVGRNLAVNFGDTPFKRDAQSATELTQLRSRLFNGITFAKFELKVAEIKLQVPTDLFFQLIATHKIVHL
ncbi:hypothetical protein PENTCL1PPCAC_13592, partial [Pristionchus entomophagus]